jgi:hypothetical protein
VKEWLIAIGWLCLTVYGLAGGLYGLLRPEKYLRAWWTPTRGLCPKSAGTPEAQTKARLVAAVAFVVGLLFLALIIRAVPEYR